MTTYNYEHFWLKHLLADLLRSVRGSGLHPGVQAPEFSLDSTSGSRVRLADLRGRPVLLHFGSGT